MTRQPEKLWTLIFRGLWSGLAALLVGLAMAAPASPEAESKLRVAGRELNADAENDEDEHANDMLMEEAEDEISEVDEEGDPVTLVAAEPPPTPLGQPIDLDHLKKAVDKLDAAVEKLKDGGPKWRSDDGPVLILQNCLISSTNPNAAFQPGQEEAKRYLALELAVWNPTQDAVILRVPEFRLVADGKEFAPKPAKAGEEAVNVGMYGEMTTGQWMSPVPVNVEIPAGKTSPLIRVVFWSLESGTKVPSLVLKYRFDKAADPKVPGVARELDLRRVERANLGLTSEQIGPAGCLAHLELNGQVSSLNAQDLVDKLESFEKLHVTRVVIEWKGQKNQNFNQRILQWFLTSSGNQRGFNPQAVSLPSFPPNIRELHFAGLPNPGNQNRNFHKDVKSAVQAAVRTVFNTLPLDMLIKEIENGHTLTRVAALTEGGGRLGAERIPLMLKLSRESDSAVQKAAIFALGSYESPAVISRLKELVVENKSPAAETALDRLCASRFPTLRQAADELVQKGLSLEQKKMIHVLSTHPRPEWLNYLVDACSSKNDQTRLLALQAINKIGHPRLIPLLEQALNSADDPLREFAYQTLAGRPESQATRPALEYAVKKLEKSPPDGITLAFLQRVRDPRVLPLLEKHYETKADAPRRELISILMSLGGEEWVQRLAGQFDKLKPDERVVVLQSMMGLRLPEAVPLAMQSLDDDNIQLSQVASSVLVSLGNDEVIETYVKSIKKAKANDWRINQWCQALLQLGTPKSRSALQELRADPKVDQSVRDTASMMLMNARNNSTLTYAISQIQNLLVAKPPDLEKARKLYEKCQSIDPNCIDAFTGHGDVLMLQKKPEKALSDYERALEMDPLDAKAVTGWAMVNVHLGKTAIALELLSKREELLKGDQDYLYKAGGVYSRAAEFAGKKEASAERDKQVDKYRVQALDCLKQSGTMADKTKLDENEDLAALRTWEPFETYKKELGDAPANGGIVVRNGRAIRVVRAPAAKAKKADENTEKKEGDQEKKDGDKTEKKDAATDKEKTEKKEVDATAKPPVTENKESEKKETAPDVPAK